MSTIFNSSKVWMSHILRFLPESLDVPWQSTMRVKAMFWQQHIKQNWWSNYLIKMSLQTDKTLDWAVWNFEDKNHQYWLCTDQEQSLRHQLDNASNLNDSKHPWETSGASCTPQSIINNWSLFWYGGKYMGKHFTGVVLLVIKQVIYSFWSNYTREKWRSNKDWIKFSLLLTV